MTQHVWFIVAYNRENAQIMAMHGRHMTAGKGPVALFKENSLPKHVYVDRFGRSQNAV